MRSGACGTRTEILYTQRTNGLEASEVADNPNFEAMFQIFRTGFCCDVMSWKMHVEEPHAAGVIASALNMPQGVSLRSTELEAIAALVAGVTSALESQTAQEVAYESVKAAVAAKLTFIVDEPEFIELFDFVISLGAGKNTDIAGLIEFGQKFVDQSSRQLRLQTFADINKLDERRPRMEIANIKRCYRQSPVYGYCPGLDSS